MTIQVQCKLSIAEIWQIDIFNNIMGTPTYSFRLCGGILGCSKIRKYVGYVAATFGHFSQQISLFTKRDNICVDCQNCNLRLFDVCYMLPLSGGIQMQFTEELMRISTSQDDISNCSPLAYKWICIFIDRCITSTCSLSFDSFLILESVFCSSTNYGQNLIDVTAKHHCNATKENGAFSHVLITANWHSVTFFSHSLCISRLSNLYWMVMPTPSWRDLISCSSALAN